MQRTVYLRGGDNSGPLPSGKQRVLPVDTSCCCICTCSVCACCCFSKVCMYFEGSPPFTSAAACSINCMLLHTWTCAVLEGRWALLNMLKPTGVLYMLVAQPRMQQCTASLVCHATMTLLFGAWHGRADGLRMALPCNSAVLQFSLSGCFDCRLFDCK